MKDEVNKFIEDLKKKNRYIKTERYVDRYIVYYYFRNKKVSKEFRTEDKNV